MKLVTLELPDQVATMLENMSDANIRNSLLLAAVLAGSKEVSLGEIQKSIDANVKRSGVSDTEVDRLLDSIS